MNHACKICGRTFVPRTPHDWYCDFHQSARAQASPSTRAQTSEYARNRRIVLKRDVGRPCGICGKPIAHGDAEIDHIIPVARGGTHDLSNLQLAHRSCNRSKRANVDQPPARPADPPTPTRRTDPPLGLRLR